MAKVLHPEWRNANLATKYPFSPRADMTNGAAQLFEGMLVDAALFAVGLQTPTYLSQVVVTHSRATLYFGDASQQLRCSGAFLLNSPPDEIDLTDDLDRPAGKLICEPLQLAAIASWGVGTHTFSAGQTELCATCVFPTPEPGVRALTDEAGVHLAGEVYLVGDEGIALTLSDEAAGDVTHPTIRVNAVGDPLFRRRLCDNTDLFATPRFIRQIRFVAKNGEFTCEPGEGGDVFIEFDDRLSARPVIRLENLPDSIKIKTIGSKINQEGNA